MGYTHSWYRGREIESSIMDQIKADFSKITAELPEESQIMDMPDFWGTPQDIAFGGNKTTCEPMIFCRVSQARRITPDRAREPWMTGKYFEFCKTEQMPYDLAVRALLMIAKKNLIETIRVFSDGSTDDWSTACDLCQKVLGYGKQFIMKAHELCLSEN